MAYSQKDWDVVKAYYERGLSLSKIIAQPKVIKSGITDRGSISKKSKQDGWIKGKNATLVTEEIEIEQAVAELAEKKAILSATELEVHNSAVAERIEAEKFLNGLDRLIIKTVALKLKSDGPSKVTYSDANMAASASQKVRAGLLGRDPAIVINNANNQAVLVSMDADEVRRISMMIDGHLV